MRTDTHILTTEEPVGVTEDTTAKLRSVVFALDRWEKTQLGFKPVGRNGFADEGFIKLAHAGGYTRAMVRYDPWQVATIGDRLIQACDGSGLDNVAYQMQDFESELHRGPVVAETGPGIELHVTLHIHAYWLGWSLFAQLHSSLATGTARLPITRGWRQYPLQLGAGRI